MRGPGFEVPGGESLLLQGLGLPPRYYGPSTSPLGREVGAVMASSSKHLAKEHCEAVWTDLLSGMKGG